MKLVNLEKFRKNLQDAGLLDESADNEQRLLNVLFDMMYSSSETLGDIDFDSFTQQDAFFALENIHFYQSDESSEPYDMNPNRENSITELNRIAHVRKLVKGTPPVRRVKRRFF
ncbi:hypothetical protein V1503_24145 [Bacillus sp. SCS-151]|uniref:hypothetical protein n=1 Tax=Nanhaiella sioensis TaxID=3115293 RepID=UPI0039792336